MARASQCPACRCYEVCLYPKEWNCAEATEFTKCRCGTRINAKGNYMCGPCLDKENEYWDAVERDDLDDE